MEKLLCKNLPGVHSKSRIVSIAHGTTNKEECAQVRGAPDRWRIFCLQGRNHTHPPPGNHLERCAELLRPELPSAVATPRASCAGTEGQKRTRLRSEGTERILDGFRGGCKQ